MSPILAPLITTAQSKNINTYYDNGWSPLTWKGSSNFPVLTDNMYYEFPYNPVSNGTITMAQSKLAKTYTDVTWDLERVWVNEEAISRPRLIARPTDLDLGTPGTHQMRYQHVIPDIEGTMNFMGLTWKSRGSFYRFPDPPAPGTIGQEVEYEVGNLEHTIFDPEQNKNIIVKFLASGIRDVHGAGGFSQYNTEYKRKVTVTNEASAQVNFYFVEPKYLPSFSYKISISTPEGVVDIIGKEHSQSYFIRMQYDNHVIGIPTVNLNDSRATNIHVSTDNGIEALQKYSEFSFTY